MNPRSLARDYGAEATLVWDMPCITGDTDPVVIVHIVPDGGRFDIVPLTAFNGADAGDAGTSQRRDFERCHGLDLRAEADRIAVEHERPRGVRGLADRWVNWEVRRLWDAPENELDGYEFDALRGWVTREMAREVGRRREWAVDLPEFDREALAHHIGTLLGGDFAEDPHGEHGLAWRLCEWATEGRWVS